MSERGCAAVARTEAKRVVHPGILNIGRIRRMYMSLPHGEEAGAIRLGVKVALRAESESYLANLKKLDFNYPGGH